MIEPERTDITTTNRLSRKFPLSHLHQPQEVSLISAVCVCVCGVCVCVRGRSGQRLRLTQKAREKKEKQTDTHLSILAGGKE